MDARKAQAPSMAHSSKRRLSGGFKELREEFKKINWTTREELKIYTKIVIGATLTVGLGIYIVDLLSRGALSGLGALVRAVIG